MLYALILLIGQAFAGTVNVNTADSGELSTLPGIGESKAAAIIQYRTEHGPFKTITDLDAVPGIGPSTLANLTPLVSFGDGKTVTTSSTTTSSPAATTSSAGCPVNINTADLSGMKKLPGIGDSKAAAILQYRTDHGGKFSSCDELDSVSGIGAATLASLRDCCTVK